MRAFFSFNSWRTFFLCMQSYLQEFKTHVKIDTIFSYFLCGFYSGETIRNCIWFCWEGWVLKNLLLTGIDSCCYWQKSSLLIRAQIWKEEVYFLTLRMNRKIREIKPTLEKKVKIKHILERRKKKKNQKNKLAGTVVKGEFFNMTNPNLLLKFI